jgi:hypothetical protein
MTPNAKFSYAHNRNLLLQHFEIKYLRGFSQKMCDNNLEKVCFDIQQALSASQLKFSAKANKIKLNRSIASFMQKNENQESVIRKKKAMQNVVI